MNHSLPLSVFLLCASYQQGAANPDELRIDRAVARYVRSQNSLRALGFEDVANSFDTPDPPEGSPGRAYRPSGHLTILLQDLRATQVRLTDSLFCARNGKPGCVQSVYRIGRPVIAGDSATVWFYAYDALSGQGSLTAAIGSTQLLMRRQDSTWVVVSRLQMSESLLGRP